MNRIIFIIVAVKVISAVLYADPLVTISENWLREDCVAEDWCSGADLDYSGNVDLHDFMLLADHWLDTSGYYVATSGSDTNPGTFLEPFATTQKAADVMSAGDTCYIRKGMYHEHVTMNGKNGTAADPITFMNYREEKVVLDGTIPITANWTQHAGNIYKTTLSEDVWQLFVDGEMMVPARWPNADPSVDLWKHLEELYWAKGNVSLDTNGVMYDSPHNGIDLAASGLDVSGAVAVLNVGSFKSQTRLINSHIAGTNMFTYDPVSITFKDKHHYYLVEAKLNLLDAEKEWFFDKDSNILYLWKPGGGDPTGSVIQGKTLTYCFDVDNCDYINLKGLDFFGATYKFVNCDQTLIEDCDFNYPSFTKRMLGVVNTTPETSRIDSSNNCIIRNCVFAYIDGYGIHTSGNYNLIENCYFHHIDYSGANSPQVMVALYTSGNNNTFLRSTLHTFGPSVGYLPGDAATILHNNISDGAYVQHDGTLIQCMVAQQTNVEIGYNWLHDNPRLGARFDGGGGSNGLVHHTVSWNLNSGVYIGNHDWNKIYNNFCIDSSPRNEIVVESGGGSNQNTMTRNNAAEAMGATNSGSDPIPGIYDHNWNGYNEVGPLRDQVRDADNLDFRPKVGSDLIDAGIAVAGITDGYLGSAPDMGAYEFGDINYWIAGYQGPTASTPIPPNGATNVKLDADLMFLQAYQTAEHEIYFGTNPNALTYQGSQSNNIFDPGPLSPSTTYYWKVNAVKDGKITEGEIWSFTTE